MFVQKTRKRCKNYIREEKREQEEEEVEEKEEEEEERGFLRSYVLLHTFSILFF